MSHYPLILARTLNHIGRYLWTQKNIQEANSLLAESRAISLKLGVEGELCLAETLNWTLNWLGLVWTTPIYANGVHGEGGVSGVSGRNVVKMLK